MKNSNKKGFTLVELLAVIVVLAIVMSLAVVAITNVLDSTRKNSFVADAKSFLEGAHQLVSSDGVGVLFGPSASTYAPTCSKGGTSDKFIPIASINLDRGGVNSPYGSPYIKKSGDANPTVTTTTPTADYSYIKVTATTDKSGNCSYTYKIYLTDGTYSIGAKDSPADELTLSTANISVKSAS